MLYWVSGDPLWNHWRLYLFVQSREMKKRLSCCKGTTPTFPHTFRQRRPHVIKGQKSDERAVAEIKQKHIGFCGNKGCRPDSPPGTRRNRLLSRKNCGSALAVRLPWVKSRRNQVQNLKKLRPPARQTAGTVTSRLFCLCRLRMRGGGFCIKHVEGTVLP